MEKLLSILPHLFLTLPLLAIVVNNAVPRARIRSYTVGMSAAVAIMQALTALTLFLALVTSGGDALRFGILSGDDGGAVCFRADLVSLFLLFCVGLVTLASTLTALTTIDDHRCSYTNLLMTIVLGMNGMLLVGDLFSLYVFLEITGTASFVMIAMFKSTRGLEGAFKYLTLSALATILILTGLAFLFMKADSLSYDAIGPQLLTDSADGRSWLCWAALVLLTSGFAIKSGVAPFHTWLPDAHQSADTAVSILLSGIVIKIAGVYGLMTLIRLFPGVAALQISLVLLGLYTIVFGAVLALVQGHFKRVAAYSSVSQMGYILLGLAAGTKLGLIGALLHIFSHAAFKSTLFTNAAALHEQTGTLELDEMGGLEKRMPVTAFSSVAALLSTAGVPPMMGFWSKLIILLALWSAHMQWVAAIALVLSIFTGAYFVRLQKKVFFGKLNPRWEGVTEVRGGIRVSEILFTAITIGAGLCFPLVLLYLQNAGLI